MARSSPKKPKPAKCRSTHAGLEGRDWVRIGGSKWLREAAVKAGKFVPIEYREGYVKAKPASAPAEEAVGAENTAEVENSAE